MNEVRVFFVVEATELNSETTIEQVLRTAWLSARREMRKHIKSTDAVCVEIKMTVRESASL